MEASMRFMIKAVLFLTIATLLLFGCNRSETMKYEPNADPTLANIRESISMDFEMEKDSIIFQYHTLSTMIRKNGFVLPIICQIIRKNQEDGWSVGLKEMRTYHTPAMEYFIRNL